MVQYINKAAVVAEIEKRKKAIVDDNGNLGFKDCQKAFNEIDELKKFINTLEVKEVDFEKEFKDFLDNVEGMPRMWHSDEQIEWAKDIARHFYELGLKAQKGE